MNLSQALQLVDCQAPLQGRFVSLEVLGEQPPAAAEQPPCFCSVQPLSFLGEPGAVLDAPEAAMPGMGGGLLASLPGCACRQYGEYMEV